MSGTMAEYICEAGLILMSIRIRHGYPAIQSLHYRLLLPNEAAKTETTRIKLSELNRREKI